MNHTEYMREYRQRTPEVLRAAIEYLDRWR